MSLTYTKVAKLAAGNYRQTIYDFKADTTYTAGGYALTTTDIESIAGIGQTDLSGVVYFKSEVSTAGVTLALDRTNKKLMFFLGSTEATTTVSTVTVRGNVYHAAVNYK